MVNHLVYDAFGNVTRMGSRQRMGSRWVRGSRWVTWSRRCEPAVDSLFLFTARPFDPDTALQNNLNRWYDAAVGRWLSEDPIGFGGGDESLYRYVGNGPLTNADPSGLGPFWDAFMCAMYATAAGFVYTGWVVSCVTCLIPGEGAGALDVPECLACVGGGPATIIAIDEAIEQCEKACDPENLQKLRQWRADVEEKLDKVRKVLGRK